MTFKRRPLEQIHGREERSTYQGKHVETPPKGPIKEVSTISGGLTIEGDSDNTKRLMLGPTITNGHRLCQACQVASHGTNQFSNTDLQGITYPHEKHVVYPLWSRITATKKFSFIAGVIVTSCL